MSNKATKDSVAGIECAYIAKNIRYLMNEKDIDARNLHAETGIAVTTINQLKRGQGNPTMTTLIALSKFFNVQIDDLLQANLEELSGSKSKAQRVPIVDIESITKNKISSLSTKGYVTIDADQENQVGSIAVEICNSSLSPMFDKGTVFIISVATKPNDGDIVLVKFGSNVPCFRRVYIEGNSHYFENIINLNRPNIQTQDKYSILGTVIKAIQKLN